MNEGERLVGVVGDPPAGLAAALSDRGWRVDEGGADAVLAADPELVVAVGDTALFTVARRSPAAPILPVDASRGFGAVPGDSADAAVEEALADGATRQTHPVLGVTLDGERVARAVADVSLLTAEVAHISEYTVGMAGTHVETFRADGIVVATPAGSPGYARRIDCPVVAPGTDVGAVAPIAPFATDPDNWVLPLEKLRLTVVRDETEVALLADDREVATVDTGDPVHVGTAGTFQVAVVPESESHF